VDIHFALQQRYADDPQIYVSADLLIYYVEGNPRKSVAPDVFVAFGVPKGERGSYRIWAEGPPPTVVFEIASPGTWPVDLTRKMVLYAQLGVQEYFLFDPTAKHFAPPLQGYVLRSGHYEALAALPVSEHGEHGACSTLLELELWTQPQKGKLSVYALRLYDPATDNWLFTPGSIDVARRAAEARAAQQAQVRRAAEAEIGRLRAELAHLRGE